MIIYKIKLPAKQDAEAFVQFMRDEYFPAIHKGATRVGKVEHMQLLQGGRDEQAGTHDFYWLVDFSGLSFGSPHVDDEAIAIKFRAFDVEPKRLGFFNKIASWKDE
jgi:hypothetical protein